MSIRTHREREREREGGREGGNEGGREGANDTYTHSHAPTRPHSEYEAAMATKTEQLAELQKYKDNDPEKIDRLRK